VLEAITRALPFDLMIVVDQGEELLTLVRTAQQRERRAKAIPMLADLSDSARRAREIRMLADLSDSAARCKIILAMRSPSLGQFVSLFPGEGLPNGWRAHQLP